MRVAYVSSMVQSGHSLSTQKPLFICDFKTEMLWLKDHSIFVSLWLSELCEF